MTLSVVKALSNEKELKLDSKKRAGGNDCHRGDDASDATPAACRRPRLSFFLDILPSLSEVCAPANNLARGWVISHAPLSQAAQDDLIGCSTGNGEKLSSSQAEPGRVFNSAVA